MFDAPRGYQMMTISFGFLRKPETKEKAQNYAIIFFFHFQFTFFVLQSDQERNLQPRPKILSFLATR